MSACQACDKPLVNRRPQTKFCDAACRQHRHRRRVDPGVGSSTRRRIQLDAYRESTEYSDIREELVAAGLMPEGDHENHPPRRRRRSYYESQAPSDNDLFDPVYAEMENARELYHGHEVEEKVKVQDTYREWLRSGKKPQPALGTVVTQKKALKVQIVQASKMDLETDGRFKGFARVPKPPKKNGESVTKEQADRIEEKIDRVLVNQGDHVAIGAEIDQFIDSATACGVQVFAETVTERS